MEPLLPQGSAAEIDRWINEGIEASLLTWETGSGTNTRSLSAEELGKLAKRLRENGKVKTAVLCQHARQSWLPMTQMRGELSWGACSHCGIARARA